MSPRGVRPALLLGALGSTGTSSTPRTSFGAFDYLSPPTFRLADAAVSLGTVGQWWISRHVALQATVLGGVGFAAPEAGGATTPAGRSLPART